MRGGGPPVQRLVGPLFVVLDPESMEGALLGRGVRPGWADGPALQRLVPPLVSAVLLWPARVNALVLNPEPHPPDVELGKAVDAAGGERDPVVGPDRAGEPVGAEGPLEDPPRPHAMGGGQAVASQQ